MTAKLPPLLFRVNEWMKDSGWQNSGIRQADLARVDMVVKLAVRDALERASDKLRPGSCTCFYVIDALLKEYSD